MDHEPDDPRHLLFWELAQRREAGYELGVLGETARDAVADRAADSATLGRLLDQVEATQRPASWEQDEPEDLAAILANADTSPALPVSQDVLEDRVLGGWLGRVAGNQLGKPVENGDHWTPAHLRDYLERADAYPLLDYIPVLDPMPPEFELRDCWPTTTRGRIHGTERDDDIDYTILGLHVLETYGRGFTPAAVAREWLDRLPYLQTFTAERVIYRNLVIGVPVAEARLVHNPYREWVGAQIRGDVFGYVCPGDPRAAAALAYRDATLSHTANGVYGEMWAAALVAAAFTSGNARTALEKSLSVMPARSRLARALRFVLASRDAGATWEQARADLADAYGSYSWIHTVNNAALVAAGLLWGDGDYSASIGLTVQGGWDTDSNGATAGSVAGILCGAAALPRHWLDPLHDTVRSAIRGFDGSHISDLAGRTVRLASPSPRDS